MIGVLALFAAGCGGDAGEVPTTPPPPPTTAAPAPPPPPPQEPEREPEYRLFQCGPSGTYPPVFPGDLLLFSVVTTVEFGGGFAASDFRKFSHENLPVAPPEWFRDPLHYYQYHLVLPSADGKVGYADIFDRTGICRRVTFPVGGEPLTHDPFPLPAMDWIYERSHQDRLDDFSGPQIHVIYALPAGGTDYHIDRTGEGVRLVESAQRFLQDELGRGLRFDTHKGVPDVTFVQLSKSAGRLTGLDAVIGAFPADFQFRPNKRYVTLLGLRHPGSRSGEALIGGGTSVIYLRPEFLAERGRIPAGRYQTFVHEIFHMLGAVDYCRPENVAPGHHVKDPSDVMAVPSGYRIDPDRNDYYGHGRNDCIDIATSAFFRGS